MLTQHKNPERLARNPAFTKVITVSGGARTVYIGGQNAVDGRAHHHRPR
jgi:hypothetical protein